jgi:hypothetical protein
VPEPAYIEACFRAYPRERRGKGATARAVAIPEDARVRIARFLLEKPAYPLLEVFHAIAKTHDFPPAMADFLADPWDAESTLRVARGTPTSAGGQRPELEQRAAREAREAVEWESLTQAEQEERLAAARRQLDATIGRKQA